MQDNRIRNYSDALALYREAANSARDLRGRVDQTTTRIVIADDHPLFRGALHQAVAGAVTNAQIEETGDFDTLRGILESIPDMDLVLLDLAMSGARGFSGLMYLRAQHPGVSVIVVSATGDRMTMRRCIDLGASGFIPKTMEIGTMRVAVCGVIEGMTWTPPDLDLSIPTDQETGNMVRRLASLTPQQMRVLMMLSEGLLNKQIAYELSVSEATVKAHVSAILQKLGVESRTQAVIAASRIEAGEWAAPAADWKPALGGPVLLTCPGFAPAVA